MASSELLIEETELIFMGTGSSGGTPKLSCITITADRCETCIESLLPDNPNNRRNTSAIIRTRWYNSQSDSRTLVNDRYILIDCGKSFLQSAITHFPKHGIPRIDAVVLTHGHADACFGLDDLRALTYALPNGKPLPIYTREIDFEVLKNVFSYMLPGKSHDRFVPSVTFEIFDPKKPLNIMDLELIPIEVEHGPGYTSLGYAFGDVLYISDLNAIYPQTRTLLTQRFKPGRLLHTATAEETNEWNQDTRIPLNVFVVDALFPEKPYPSHYSMPQAIEEIKRLRPKLGLTVGMSHQMNHHQNNEDLKKYLESDNLQIELGFDGQVVSCNLRF